MIQYTAVTCCLGRAIIDIAQIPLRDYFFAFQKAPEFGIYTLVFFLLLEIFPLSTLVYVVGVHMEARKQAQSELIPAQEDVFLESYSTDVKQMNPL